jgi:hypothetical protein
LIPLPLKDIWSAMFPWCIRKWMTDRAIVWYNVYR